MADVAEVTSGQSPPGSSYNQDGIGMEFHQGKKHFGDSALNASGVWTTDVKRKALPGDIVMSVRAPVGPINYVEREVCIGRGLASIRAKRSIQKGFLAKFLLMNEGRINGHAGATFNSINKKEIEGILVPCPPIAEQERLVEVLDEAFAAIDKAKANIERNLTNARELFQSRLNDIFSNPSEDWVVQPLGEVCSKIGSGATPRGGRSSYKQEGISLIRSMNVHDLKFASKGLAFIDELQAKGLDNVALFPEDVLLNITGASITRCCVVEEGILPARVNQHVSILRPIEMLDSDFLALMLVSDYYKKQLLSFGEKGATRQALTKSFLQDFLVRVPSVETQEKVVTELGVLRRNTKAMEGVYQSELDNLEELRQSILEQAFEGKLTEPVAA